MHSWVNLVVISLALGYLVNRLNSLHVDTSKRETEDLSTVPSNVLGSNTRDRFSRKLRRPVSIKIHQFPTTTSAISTKHKNTLTNGSIKVNDKGEKNAIAIAKTNKLALIHDLNAKPKTGLERRDKRKKHKHKMSRVLMALLLAYKLKFAALIPTIIGGLALLVSTTALAGFFFALFAAVLGLKGQ